MSPTALRGAVVAEARRWIGTPYHHRANILGAGVDCARLLIEVYAAAGVIDWFDPGDYPPDWHLHRSEERYVAVIERFAAEFDPVTTPVQPADVLVWRYGRTFSHGGVVTGQPGASPATGWPWIVHAFAAARIVEEACVIGSMLDGRPMRAFRPHGLSLPPLGEATRREAPSGWGPQAPVTPSVASRQLPQSGEQS
jgi:NlpC/P60 family putative phage cell wall peptidase